MQNNIQCRIAQGISTVSSRRHSWSHMVIGLGNQDYIGLCAMNFPTFARAGTHFRNRSAAAAPKKFLHQLPDRVVSGPFSKASCPGHRLYRRPCRVDFSART